MRREITTGLLFIALGGLLLANNLGMIDFNLRQWWPAILVIIGIGMLFERSN